MARLIVTNGDAAIARLRAAGIEDDILAWSDVLHDGPVPAGLSLEALSAARMWRARPCGGGTGMRRG